MRAARTTARTDAAIAWQHTCQALIVDVVEPWAHGSVLRSPLAPDWWDANLVRLEGPDPGMSAAELMAVVGMANESNRLASGYQVEIDEKFRTTAPAAGK